MNGLLLPRPARLWYLGLTLLGLVLLAAAFLGAQGEDRLDDQILWLDVAVVGSLAAAGAQVLVLTVGRLRLGQRRRHVLAPFEQQVPAELEPGPREVGVVTVPGTRLYHLSTCLLARGKAVRPARQLTRLQPCEVCRP